MKKDKEIYLIISLGSIGQRHLKNLKQLKPNAKIIVLRSRINKTFFTLESEVIEVYSLEEAITYSPNAAIIASPAVFHVEQAKILLSNGIPVLIEKPISDSLTGVGSMLETAYKQSVVLMTGYTLRFHSVVKKLKMLVSDNIIGKIINISVNCGQYLPDWRPNIDYRKTVSAKKKLGGGVLLELSHEFDYLRWLIGDVEALIADIGNSKRLEIDVEDSATILLKFYNGSTGMVHLDFLQKKPQRFLVISGYEGNIHGDIINQTINLNTQNGCETFQFNSLKEKHNNMYLDEIKHFLSCVESKEQPIVDGKDGLEALKIVEAIKYSAKHKSWVQLRNI